MRALLALIFVIAAVLVALAAGLWLGGHPSKLPEPLREAFVEDERALLSEVRDLIVDDFYRPVVQRAEGLPVATVELHASRLVRAWGTFVHVPSVPLPRIYHN